MISEGVHALSEGTSSQAEALYAQRVRVHETTYDTTPERFVRRPPRPPALPTGTWINKPDTGEAAH